MNYCVCCGLSLPADQGSRTCSMCYGDIAHGRDGYYEEWARNFEILKEEAISSGEFIVISTQKDKLNF